MRPIPALILSGLTAASAVAEPSLKELQLRFPRMKAAYLQWQYQLEEAKPGFWSGVTDHEERFHSRYVVLRAETKPTRVVSSPLPDHAKLSEGWVSWTLPDGKVEKIPVERFQSRKIGAVTRIDYALPALPAGTQVEEHFVGQVPGIIDGFRFLALPKESALVQGTFQMVMPGAKTFKLKNLHGEQDPKKLVIGEAPDGRRKISLDLSGILPADRDPLSPFRILPMALTWDTRNYPTYLNPPEDIVRQFHRRLDSRSPWFSDAVRNRLGTITEGKTTDRGRVEAVLSYIHSNIRKIGSEQDKGGGLFGLGRMNFADMLSKGEATADGMQALMMEMLGKLGIPAKMVLIHAPWNGPFDPNYIASHEDYEGAVWVDLHGGPLLAFPHRPERPLGHLDRFQMNRPAIVIKDASTLEVLRTPASLAQENRYDDAWTLQIDPSGKGDLQFERRITGPEALDLRGIWNRTPPAKQTQADTVWEFCPGEPLGMPVQGSVANADAKDKPLGIQLRLQLPVICRSLEGEVELSPLATALGLGLGERVPVKDHTRTEPIWIAYDQTIQRTLRIKAPAAWKRPTQLPSPREVKNELGSAQATFTLEGEDIRVDQTLKLVHGLHPASKAKELLQLIGVDSPMAIPALRFR